MAFISGLVTGIFIGAFIGLLTVSLCVAASDRRGEE